MTAFWGVPFEMHPVFGYLPLPQSCLCAFLERRTTPHSGFMCLALFRKEGPLLLEGHFSSQDEEQNPKIKPEKKNKLNLDPLFFLGGVVSLTGRERSRSSPPEDGGALRFRQGTEVVLAPLPAVVEMAVVVKTNGTPGEQKNKWVHGCSSAPTWRHRL